MQQREGPLPAILKCPSSRGEEWPAESFKSYVSAKAKVITHEDITWLCPAGHTFTLKKAVEKGMFTPDEALKMIALAQKELPEAKRQVAKAVRTLRAKPKRSKEAGNAQT